MKRKTAITSAALASCLILAGCGSSSGISRADYDKAVGERDEARAELEALKETTVTREEYDAVVAERDELKAKQEESEAGEEEQAPEKMEVQVGDTFTANGLEITIEGSDLEYMTYNQYYDEQVYGLGMKYVGISFSVNNVSDAEKSVSAYDFDGYADNSLCDRASFYEGKYGSISPGRNTSFSLYWKVPEDAGTIEVEYAYNDGFLTKKTVTIKVK